MLVSLKHDGAMEVVALHLHPAAAAAAVVVVVAVVVVA